MYKQPAKQANHVKLEQHHDRNKEGLNDDVNRDGWMDGFAVLVVSASFMQQELRSKVQVCWSLNGRYITVALARQPYWHYTQFGKPQQLTVAAPSDRTSEHRCWTRCKTMLSIEYVECKHMDTARISICSVALLAVAATAKSINTAVPGRLQRP